MRFGIVTPHTRSISTSDFPDSDAAKAAAGLKPMETDHGAITRDVFIIVDEFGLLETRPGQAYFALFPNPGHAGSLFAGGAVLYAIGGRGETIDFDPPDWLALTQWLADAAAAEDAIQRGEVMRPRTTVNGVVCWEWRP